MNLSQITQAIIYNVDQEMRGRVDQMTIGEIGFQEVEHNTLGQVAMLRMPGRPVQAISATLTLAHVERELERELLNPRKLHDWQMHQRVDVADQDGISDDLSHTIVHHVKFHTMQRGDVNQQLGEKSTLEYDCSITMLRIIVNNESTPIMELDVFNNVYRVNGEDVWPN